MKEETMTKFGRQLNGLQENENYKQPMAAAYDQLGEVEKTRLQKCINNQ